MLPVSPSPSRIAALLPNVFLVLLSLILFGAGFAAKPVIQVGGAVLGLVCLVGVILAWRKNLIVTLVEIRLPLLVAMGTVLMVALSAIWSIRPDVAIAAAPKLLGIFTLGFAMQIAARRMNLPSSQLLVILPLALAGGLVAVLLMLAGDLGLQAWWSGGNVMVAVVNKGIGSMTFFIPAAFALAWGRGRQQNTILILIILASLSLAVFSQAQSALMALLVMAIVMILPLRWRLFWHTLRLMIMAGVMLSPWIVHQAFEPFAKDISTGFMRDQASAPQRLEVWHAIAGEIFNRPYLGHGYDSTRYIEHFNSDEIYQAGTTFMHPHNMALQFWMEFGIVGAFLGGLALIMAVRSIERVPDIRVRRLYLSTFLSMLAVSLVGWGMWQTWWIVLFFMLWSGTVYAGRIMVETPDKKL